MKKIAFFDTKPYDRTWFDILAKHYEIAYFEEKLNRHTATLTDGFDAVCAFVNDRVDAAAIDRMHRCGVQLLALRCAGFSNVDMQAAAGKLRVVRVPAYSPHAVAEHTMGLLLTLNRRLHRAYIRTRDFNFSIVGLTGIDSTKRPSVSSARGASAAHLRKSAAALACAFWRMTSILRRTLSTFRSIHSCAKATSSPCTARSVKNPTTCSTAKRLTK